MMKKILLICAVLLLSTNFTLGQETRVRKGDNYFKHFSYSKAIVAYEGVKMKSLRIFRNLAESYLMLGNTEKAEENYAELINSGKYKPFDVYNYSSVLQMNKRYEEASKWMQKYATLRPSDSRGIRYTKIPNYYQELLVKDTGVVLNNLEINTKYQDFSPAYFRNDKVAFASSRDNSHLVNRKWNGNNQPFLDLYLANVIENNVLTKVQKFSTKINKRFHDAPATFNKEGSIMIVTRNDYDFKESKNQLTDNNLMLYESLLGDDNVWSEPEKLEFNNKKYSCGQASLTSDGQKMYFASNMPGGFGGTDIYVVERVSDGSWGTPTNLGGRINTEGNEMFPYFDEKNNFLFFASNGLPGLGGLDIFVSKIRKNGTFSVPTNMGAPVNSNKDDFSFIYKKEGSGFMSSNREGGKGDDDIYGFVNLHKFKERINDYYLSGVIIDKNTGKPLDFARVTLYDKNGNMIGDFETAADGKYNYPIDYGETYKMVVQHNGYNPEESIIDTKKNGRTNVVKNFEFVKVKTVDDEFAEICSIKVSPLYYNLDKSRIISSEKETLDRIVTLLNKYPQIILGIASYTDARATKRYNIRLSKRRTKAVVKYLVSQGIDKDRLVLEWYGESNPVNRCVDGVKCSEEEHRMNRRSEFTVLNCKK